MQRAGVVEPVKLEADEVCRLPGALTDSRVLQQADSCVQAIASLSNAHACDIKDQVADRAPTCFAHLTNRGANGRTVSSRTTPSDVYPPCPHYTTKVDPTQPATCCNGIVASSIRKAIAEKV